MPLAKVIASAGRLLEGSLPPVITLETVIEDDAIAARIDPTQMETALINLAFNARDAMPEGGTLRILLSETLLDRREADEIGLPPGRYACIAVEDTGTGMDPETRLRVFEPFFSPPRPSARAAASAFPWSTDSSTSPAARLS
ncbi:ATP-binding protein [Roseibium salinum]|nr:ATP-binding protein [Roseibium salinum]